MSKANMKQTEMFEERSEPICWITEVHANFTELQKSFNSKSNIMVRPKIWPRGKKWCFKYHTTN